MARVGATWSWVAWHEESYPNVKEGEKSYPNVKAREKSYPNVIGREKSYPNGLEGRKKVTVMVGRMEGTEYNKVLLYNSNGNIISWVNIQQSQLLKSIILKFNSSSITLLSSLLGINGPVLLHLLGNTRKYRRINRQ